MPHSNKERQSNIGNALEKIIGPRAGSTEMVDTRHDNTVGLRRFEYEDGVIARSVEAREQIQRMAQPFVFSREELARNHIIVQGDENEEALTLLKDLRNRITLKQAALGATILVTTIGEPRGASILARNLAAIISTDESRTSLLLEAQDTDAELHDKSQNATGLYDFLNSDTLSVADVIHPTGIPRMRVIPFGEAQSINFDYLRSTRMRILIKDVTRRYPRDRFTVIDAPPVDKVADVELLNEYADIIVLCIPYGKVTLADAKRGIAKLDKTKLLGTVLLGTPRLPATFKKFAQ